jgi:hypothetical protein
VGQEFRLVGGHVDVDRALFPAAFAGQAQVERVAYFRRSPAAGDDLAADHLHQHPGAAAGGVFFLAGDPVARAHDAALVSTAFADAHATCGGGRERAAVGRVAEERGSLGREPAAQGQVLIEPVRLDDLARVHLVARIERRLELAERADQLRSEHPGQQLAPGLPVTVLA